MPLNNPYLYLIWYDLVMFKIFGRKYIAGIDITNRCNLRCRYCYHKKYLNSHGDASLEEWKRRFKEYSRRGIRSVFFAGGEPSLRYDVLKVAERYFLYVNIFTNGQIKIHKEFHHRIYLSLDGLKENHNNNRGEGTFEKAVKNYKGDKRVIIHCILSKENYTGLKGFIGGVRKLRTQGLLFSFYCPPRGEDNTLVLNDKQRLKVKETLLRELKRKDSILLMTKEMVNYLVERRVAKRCALRENVLLFTTENQTKSCFNESVDCSRCGCLFARTSPPFWNLSGWFLHKKIIYDHLFKLS